MSQRHVNVMDGREARPDAAEEYRYFVTVKHWDPKIETDVLVMSGQVLRQLRDRIDSVLEDLEESL